MAKSVMLTTEGYQKLVAELEYLSGEKKMEVAEKIKVARSFGDLSENSEYEDAKNEQGILEARIATIEATLKVAVVIDENNISTETIHVGSVVRLENLKLQKEVTYMITGSSEANPKEAKLSDESPIGKALIGHSVGDVVEVETPSGIIGFKVLGISKK